MASDIINTWTDESKNRPSKKKIFAIFITLFICFVVLYRLEFNPPLTKTTRHIMYTVTMYEDGTKMVLKTESIIRSNLKIPEWILLGQEIYVDNVPDIISSQALTWEEYQSGK